MVKPTRGLFSFTVLAFIVALFTNSTKAEELENVDPWEGFNRSIYKFNDVADRYALKPVAKVYDKITPQFIDSGITRFFDNLLEPASMLNALLQGKVVDAGKIFGRFIINTTAGLAGTMDVATKLGVEAMPEDFGQTLAVWGVESGPYLVLPLLGPSTLRDAFSRPVDTYTDPVTYVDHVRTRNSAKVIDLIDVRSDLLGTESLISGDRYVFIRDAYLQRRAFLVSDGEMEDSFEDDFGDFDDEEGWEEE